VEEAIFQQNTSPPAPVDRPGNFAGNLDEGGMKEGGWFPMEERGNVRVFLSSVTAVPGNPLLAMGLVLALRRDSAVGSFMSVR
jgi:hypothetical protein